MIWDDALRRKFRCGFGVIANVIKHGIARIEVVIEYHSERIDWRDGAVKRGPGVIVDVICI